MQEQVEIMADKLEQLTPSRLAEVEDFIDFLQQRDQNVQIKHDYTIASETSFKKVWDNEEDSIYDSL